MQRSDQVLELDHYRRRRAARVRSSQQLAERPRIHELAAFLDCPVDALAGALMDALADDPQLIRRIPRGAA